ncbi:MAG: hypothetical protein SOY04_15250 [Clostridium celatum]|nr:hypothetical protein [Clostridium celatum]
MSKLTKEIKIISTNQKQDLMQIYEIVNGKLGEHTVCSNTIQAGVNETKFAPKARELEQMKEALLGEARASYNQAVLLQKNIKIPYVNQLNGLIKVATEEVD